MEKEKKKQKEAKDITYKDCVWYMEDIDRCKLPGIRERYMACMAQDKGEMGDFCIWITNFITPREEVKEPKEVQLDLFDLEDAFGFGKSTELAPESYMEKLFKDAYSALKRWKDTKEDKDEDGWSIENSSIESAGNYEITTTSGAKTVVARASDGESLGFGNITPAEGL